MTIEDRDDAHLITHALAKDTLSRLRDVETEQVAFRKGLVKLGRICGYGSSTVRWRQSTSPSRRRPRDDR